METNILFIILVTFFAGMGAGLGTGFAGMSAAAVISPMLIAFLKMDHYMAVGIALSSDVLASAVSAYTYGKNKNLDIKNAIFIGHNDGINSYKDMQLMSNCQHNIIANSTFSWWGAWLNSNKKKIVISPNQWMQSTNGTGDIIPENWIKIGGI